MSAATEPRWYVLNVMHMALAGRMAAAQVECAAPVAAQIRHQDEDGQWSEWAGIPLSHAGSNFLTSVQVRLLYEAGQLSPRMTGTDHAAELAHRTCSRYKHDQNPALVEYTFNQHTLGDFVRKLVAALDDSGLKACFDQIKSDLIADGAVEHDLRLEFFPEAVLDAFRRQLAARIESQQRLADAQGLAAKAGLAHRMAVQRCVHAAVAEAVAAEREACAALCESWNTAMTDNLAEAIRARGAQPTTPPPIPPSPANP